MNATATPALVCDNASVGVLIADQAGRLLMFERVRPPLGTAPPAGHVDDHGGYESAAAAEVAEEVGLTVVSLDLVAEGWRGNRCRREAGPFGVGHYWRVYAATVTGELDPDAAEARNAGWYTPAEVREPAARTVVYATGGTTTSEFAAQPGIEPVWLRWLTAAGVVADWLPDAALPAVERLAKGQPPAGAHHARNVRPNRRHPVRGRGRGRAPCRARRCEQLARAGRALAVLQERLYDVEFCEGPAGADVAVHLADAARSVRAASVLTAAVTA